MKNYFILISILICSAYHAQVGMFNDKPRGALDINYINGSNYSNPFGLVLPTNSLANIVTPQGGTSTVVPGTIIFDNTEDCIKLRQQAGWSTCLQELSVPRPGTGSKTGQAIALKKSTEEKKNLQKTEK